MRRQLLVIAAALIIGSAAIICCRTVAAGPSAGVSEEHQRDAAAVRTEFLRRLRRLADIGNLFSQEIVASILDLDLSATTIENDPPLSCAAHFRTTTLTPSATSWFRPLPSGAGHIEVPAFTINPATVSGDPELTYRSTRSTSKSRQLASPRRHGRNESGNHPAMSPRASVRCEHRPATRVNRKLSTQQGCKNALQVRRFWVSQLRFI